jgi:hypothetical protein
MADYHSDETVVEAARQGPVVRIKGYSHDMFTQKKSRKQLLV